MYDFTYHRPASLEEAVALFEGADDAVYLAGGHTLLPTLKQRLAAPSDVIDLSAIAGLADISRHDTLLTIGALARHGDIAASPLVKEALPALAGLAGDIGDPQVRERGTLGGSIANSDPAADYPAALLALGATIKTDRRAIAAEEFFTDLFETALAEGEIVTRVDFPVVRRAAYCKFPNPASRYAMVGVFVAQADSVAVRLVVTGAGPCVFRVAAMEQALATDFSPAALEGITVSADTLNSDLHASAEYRAHLVGVMACRAVTAAAG